MCEHAVSADSGFDRESKYQVDSLASLSSNQGNKNLLNPHMHHPSLTYSEQFLGGSYSPMSFRIRRHQNHIQVI